MWELKNQISFLLLIEDELKFFSRCELNVKFSHFPFLLFYTCDIASVMGKCGCFFFFRATTVKFHAATVKIHAARWSSGKMLAFQPIGPEIEPAPMR